MAKGVEDTAFYRYNRFVALNEVGSPGAVWPPPLVSQGERRARPKLATCDAGDRDATPSAAGWLGRVCRICGLSRRVGPDRVLGSTR
jgi:hypothetical protein